MDPLGVGAALAAAAIWALVIFLYKRHMESLDAAAVNFSRLLYVAVLLASTALFIEPAPGLWAAVVSGVVTLFVGDSLYFYAIHKVGGSVAAPLAYTYIVMAQYFALLLGEEVSQWLFLSSILAVAGVSLLAGGGGARLSPLGLAAAAAALLWSLGMMAVKLAVLGSANPLAVAYLRTASACAALGLYLAAKRRLKVVKSPPPLCNGLPHGPSRRVSPIRLRSRENRPGAYDHTSIRFLPNNATLRKSHRRRELDAQTDGRRRGDLRRSPHGGRVNTQRYPTLACTHVHRKTPTCPAFAYLGGAGRRNGPNLEGRLSRGG
jgi:DME family drug/metabolite transporter